MTRLLFHGSEMDSASARTIGGPEAMAQDHSVCLTALMTRVQAHIEAQMENLTSEDLRIATIQELITAGLPAEPQDVRDSCLRGVIGGSMTYGMHLAFELMRENRRLGS